MVKVKCRQRSKVRWPKVDADAEKLCNSGHGCQAVSEYSAPEPMAQANPPSGPWQNCAADILGPLPSGENLLVIVDYYGRYFEVVILRSTTSKKVIDSLQPIFTRFGVPAHLKQTMVLSSFQRSSESSLRKMGQNTEHLPICDPKQMGGQKVIPVAQIEGKDTQMTTGVALFCLMFGWEMWSKLPELRHEALITNKEICDQDQARKMTQKDNVDTKRHAVEGQVEARD